MLFLVIWASFLTTIWATPPACFLNCINHIAPFCPDKQADVECICHLNDAVDQCITQYCFGIHSLSARDHFLGTCSEYDFQFERSGRHLWPLIDDHQEGENPVDESFEAIIDEKGLEEHDCGSDTDSTDYTKKLLSNCMDFILKETGKTPGPSAMSEFRQKNAYSKPFNSLSGGPVKKRRPRRKGKFRKSSKAETQH